jgi:hypothetical protein
MKMKVERGKEYSCSLYLVSYEFEVLELKVKTVFRLKQERSVASSTPAAACCPTRKGRCVHFVILSL